MQRHSNKAADVGSRGLMKGTPVQIIGTDNVIQRVPHLVGKQGIIKDLPVHPATWIKVEFIDGTIATFRPSALKAVSENGEDFSDADSDKILDENRSMNQSNKSFLGTNHSNGKSDGSFSTMDQEFWASQEVRVRSGHHMGLIGRIIGAGNGWVQIKTSEGEVAKRAYELELLSGHDIKFKSSVTSLKRSNKIRAANTHSSHNISYEKNYHPRKKSTFFMTSSNNMSDNNTSNLDNSTKIPLLTLFEAKRLHRKSFIEKRIRHEKPGSMTRSYWLKIQNHEIIDTTIENTINDDFNHTHCQDCYTEMWLGCSFCCNEYCMKSPMYYKQQHNTTTTSTNSNIFSTSHDDNDIMNVQCMNFAAEALLMLRSDSGTSFDNDNYINNTLPIISTPITTSTYTSTSFPESTSIKNSTSTSVSILPSIKSSSEHTTTSITPVRINNLTPFTAPFTTTATLTAITTSTGTTTATDCNNKDAGGDIVVEEERQSLPLSLLSLPLPMSLSLSLSLSHLSDSNIQFPIPTPYSRLRSDSIRTDSEDSDPGTSTSTSNIRGYVSNIFDGKDRCQDSNENDDWNMDRRDDKDDNHFIRTISLDSTQ
eukprot:gene1617-3126_t